MGRGIPNSGDQGRHSWHLLTPGIHLLAVLRCLLLVYFCFFEAPRVILVRAVFQWKGVNLTAGKVHLQHDPLVSEVFFFCVGLRKASALVARKHAQNHARGTEFPTRNKFFIVWAPGALPGWFLLSGKRALNFDALTNRGIWRCDVPNVRSGRH